MKVIISGGGTGGHIYPAISIAKTILDRERNAEILYVGTGKGLESYLVPREGLKFASIRVKGFRRKLSLDTVKTVIELCRGMMDADKIVRQFKPDIVIGTGGYVAGPVLMTAALRGIPTLIHEQNVLPGITNRMLARFVDKVAVSFSEALKYIHDDRKAVVTGNPVRKEILEKDRETSTRVLGFDGKKPLVVVFGGSKGSARINRAMANVISRLYLTKKFQLLHVTGSDHYHTFMNQLKDRGIDLRQDAEIKIMEYLHKMPEALAAADLIVTSAGAITLSEITAVGVPAILIPKSYATDNHQEYNARALEKKGAAVVILERELEGNSLYSRIDKLVGDEKMLTTMRKASRQMGTADAADRIYEMIEQLVQK